MSEETKQRRRAMESVGVAATKIAEAAQEIAASRYAMARIRLQNAMSALREADYAADLAQLISDNVR